MVHQIDQFEERKLIYPSRIMTHTDSHPNTASSLVLILVNDPIRFYGIKKVGEILIENPTTFQAMTLIIIVGKKNSSTY